MSDDDWLGRWLPPDPEWKRHRRLATGINWLVMGAVAGLVAASVAVTLGLFVTAFLRVVVAR